MHGVTTEECQAALQSHSWNVQRAAQYLKVPPTSCPLWLSGTLKTVLRLCSHPLPPSPQPPSSAPPWPSAPRPQCVPWHHPLLPRWSSSLVWVCGHEASATTYWRCSTGTWSRPAATCWAPAALPTTSEQTLHLPSSCPRASRCSHPGSSQHCTATQGSGPGGGKGSQSHKTGSSRGKQFLLSTFVLTS